MKELKTYKGYELVKAMSEGNIKEGSRFFDSYGEYIYMKNDLGELELKRKDGQEYTVPDYSFFTESDNIFKSVENLEIDDDKFSEIEADLEKIMNDDFDEIEQIIRNEVDLSDKTKSWLNELLHKDMNRFFIHLMQRLGNKTYLERR